MRLILRLFYLQAKRLVSRPGFWLVLLLMPLLTAGIHLAAQKDAGILTVALAMEDPGDPIAQSAVEALKQTDTLRFLQGSPQEAEGWVKTGTADAAWIFGSNLQEKLSRFAAGDYTPLVSIIQRQEDSSLNLAKEQLQASVFPRLSYELYRSYCISRFGPASEETLRQAYEQAITMDELLVIQTQEGAPIQMHGNYLTVILRGLLCLVVILSGLAAGMFSMEDHKRGVFWRFSPLKKAGVSYIGILCACLLSGAVAYLGIQWSIGGNWLWEGFCMLLFIPAAAGFCLCYTALFRDPLKAGCFLPFVMLGLLFLTPIFFNLPALSAVQCLFPGFHYLYTVADPLRLPWFIAYSLFSLLLGLALFCLRNRKSRKQMQLT